LWKTQSNIAEKNRGATIARWRENAEGQVYEFLSQPSPHAEIRVLNQHFAMGQVLDPRIECRFEPVEQVRVQADVRAVRAEHVDAEIIELLVGDGDVVLDLRSPFFP